MASSAKATAGPALVRPSQKHTVKPKPNRPLPFDRVAFPKQLELVRAYAAASSQGNKPVSNSEVASIAGLAPETVSMCNGFLAAIGFIQKAEGGWLVSPDVMAFFRAFDWNKETASHKLAPLVQASWFGQALIPKLSFRVMEEEEAITLLAESANAGPDYKRHLRMLVDCLESVGLIQREGTQLKLRSLSAVEPNSPRQEASSASEEPQSMTKAKVVTSFSQLAQGTMRFNVSFDVDLSEMAHWRADRIAAFFNGIAQVLAAKAEVEKTASN